MEDKSKDIQDLMRRIESGLQVEHRGKITPGDWELLGKSYEEAIENYQSLAGQLIKGVKSDYTFRMSREEWDLLGITIDDLIAQIKEDPDTLSVELKDGKIEVNDRHGPYSIGIAFREQGGHL